MFFYLFIYFFMAALFFGPGERRFAKVFHVVDLECHWRSYYLDFFLVILKLQGGPKSDEIWHIFRPRRQTFCSHARTRQNIVILTKKLVKHRWFFYNVCHVWWTLAYKPLRSTRHKILKKWHAWIACDMSYFRLLDASTTTPEPLNLNPLIPTP